MAWPAIVRMQVAKDLSTNASLITTPPFYIGHLRQLSVSVSTQSNNATNIQVSNADGFQSPIPENSWVNILPISVQSVFNLTTGARWSRTSSPASSNATIIFVGRT